MTSDPTEDFPFLERERHIKMTRSKLPHWHQDGKMQFVTFRLGDSLPQCALNDLRAIKESFLSLHKQPLNDTDTKSLLKLINQRDEEWLNSNYGSCVLKNKEIAQILEEVILNGEGIKYDLLDYVIMPNHVHALLTPYLGVELSAILKAWKGVSSRKIRVYGTEMNISVPCPLWHKESFDRIIRSEDHQKYVHHYINKNIRQGGVRWMAWKSDIPVASKD